MFNDKTDSKGHIYQKRQTKKDTTISPLIEWTDWKNGADRKNGTESMFSAKRKK